MKAERLRFEELVAEALAEARESGIEVTGVPRAYLNGEGRGPQAGAPRSMADLLADPPAHVPRLLEPAVIVEQGLTILAGPTKVGKTNLWFHIARSLTTGHPLFGRFHPSGSMPVLMIQLELSEAVVYERLRLLAEELGWPEEARARFFVRCGRSLLLDRKGGIEKVMEIVEGCPERPAVVILDPINAAMAGDPDKSAEARRALHALREVQERTGIAWCVTAEIRKAPPGTRLRYDLDDLKGSNDPAYDADTIVILRPLDEGRRRLAIRFVAMRHAVGDAPEGLVLVRRGLTFDLTEGGASPAEDDIAEAIREHLASGGPNTARAIYEAVRARGIRARKELIDEVRRRVVSDGPEPQPEAG